MTAPGRYSCLTQQSRQIAETCFTPLLHGFNYTFSQRRLRRNTHIHLVVRFNAPLPSSSLCHTHKEISDCSAFFSLLPLGTHVLLIYTSKRCSKLLLNIPNSLTQTKRQTRRKCNWHTQRGALTWPRALVFFGVLSMIFSLRITFRSVVSIHQTNLIMSKDKKEICQSRHD